MVDYTGLFQVSKDAIAAVLRWGHREYAEWRAGWFDRQIFAEIAFDGNNSVVYERNYGTRDTAVGAYVRR